jgi:hypothetical protein
VRPKPARYRPLSEKMSDYVVACAKSFLIGTYNQPWLVGCPTQRGLGCREVVVTAALFADFSPHVWRYDANPSATEESHNSWLKLNGHL